jgi:hypothetical protein
MSARDVLAGINYRMEVREDADTVKLLAAVEAVLDLHRHFTLSSGAEWCALCQVRYPCPNVAAITAALEGK